MQKQLPITISDNRVLDLASGNKVTPQNNKTVKVDSGYLKNIVQKAKLAGVDPYTALAIAHQESDFGRSDGVGFFRIFCVYLGIKLYVMADKKEVSKILSNVKAMVSDTIPKQSQMRQADLDAINGKRKNQSPTQARLGVGGGVGSDSTKAKNRVAIMKAQSSGDFVDSKDASELESSRIANQRIPQDELKKRVAAAQAQQAARSSQKN